MVVCKWVIEKLEIKDEFGICCRVISTPFSNSYKLCLAILDTQD